MFSTIVAATDGSEPAERAVRVASALAAAGDAELILVHVMDPGTSAEELRHFAEAENLTASPARTETDEAMLRAPGPVGLTMTGASGERIDMAAVKESVGQRILQRALEVAGEIGAPRIDAVLGRGDTVDEILSVAERRQADAIVVGSRGLGGVVNAVLGSVSGKIARRAKGTCVAVT